MQNQKLRFKGKYPASNMLSLLQTFQQNDMFVDVTISCEGKSVRAHKVILSACSPYFQNIFMENPCQHPIVIISGMKFEDIKAVLNFMYRGEVNVFKDGLSSFLQAAETLKVKGLPEVGGEKKEASVTTQEEQQIELNRPQMADTPRKRPRNRKRNRNRSLSHSNRSDDEALSHKHKKPSSPKVHELYGDNILNGPPFNSIFRVPQNVYSSSHQSSSNMGEDNEGCDVEMLEQTDSNVSLNNTVTDNNLGIEHIMGNATEIESSSLADPETLPDTVQKEMKRSHQMTEKDKKQYKRQTWKRTEDPNVPDRADYNRSAFIWLCNNVKDTMRDSEILNAAFHLGKRWTKVSGDVRAKYEALAATNKDFCHGLQAADYDSVQEKTRFHQMTQKDKIQYESENENKSSEIAKDPNAPERALSAFLLFCNDEYLAEADEHLDKACYSKEVKAYRKELKKDSEEESGGSIENVIPLVQEKIGVVNDDKAASTEQITTERIVFNIIENLVSYVSDLISESAVDLLSSPQDSSKLGAESLYSCDNEDVSKSTEELSPKQADSK